MEALLLALAPMAINGLVSFAHAYATARKALSPAARAKLEAMLDAGAARYASIKAGWEAAADVPVRDDAPPDVEA